MCKIEENSCVHITHQSREIINFYCYHFTEREYNVEHEDYTEATTNLALEWTKTPKEAIRFHTPEHKNRGGSQGNKNANTIKVEKLELGWDDE